MRFDRRNKLEKLGFHKDWLDNVYKYFTPKKNGKYEMVITYIEDLGDDPKDGILIERTSFDNAAELSIIHFFFEGYAYVLTVAETGRQIGEGIIDGALFDECSEYETGDCYHPDWEMVNYTLEEIIKNNRKTQMYYSGLEKEYHKAVKDNKQLRDENTKLKEKLDRVQSILNCL